MTPNSGQISFSQIATELGLPLSNVSLGSSTVREYSFVPSGAISMSDNYAVYKDTISSNTQNVNMRSRAVSAGWNQSTPLKHTLTLNSEIIVGSTSTSNPALDTGNSFPTGSKMRINNNNGYIVGRGGIGGDVTTGVSGQPGGVALKLQTATEINNTGVIGGGGGGGAGGTWMQYYGYGRTAAQAAPGGGGAGSITNETGAAFLQLPWVKRLGVVWAPVSTWASTIFPGTTTTGGNGSYGYGDTAANAGVGGAAGVAGSSYDYYNTSCMYKGFVTSCFYDTDFGICGDDFYYNFWTFVCWLNSNNQYYCTALSTWGCDTPNTLRTYSPAGGGGLGAAGGSSYYGANITSTSYQYSPGAVAPNGYNSTYGDTGLKYNSTVNQRTLYAGGAGGAATQGAGTYATWIATGTRYGTIG